MRPTYVWDQLEALLKIDERILRNVVFIGAENERGFIPYGTAALGYTEYEGYTTVILITCPHVVDQIPGDLIAIRVNRKDGSSETRWYEKKHLIGFEDKAIDVCGSPITLDPSIYDISPFPLSSEKFRQAIFEMGPPGAGDPVCVVGLYTSHFGYVRNRPVVRMGHIAAMIEEKIMTNRGYTWGFLIECHSIAGLSGSPVFWMKDEVELIDGKIRRKRGYIALGILIGHHVIETKEDEIIVPQFQNEQLDEHRPKGTEERRTGFAVVLPINHAHKIVESDLFMKRTKEAFEEFKKNGPKFREASAVPSHRQSNDLPASAANPTHREDFNSLLGEAARKRERED